MRFTHSRLAPSAHSSAAMLASATLTLLCLASASEAATIAPGNLVVYRVGDGTAALGSAATAVFIDEYTTSGVLVQSIPMPTTLTAVGNSSTEGVITTSANGQALYFTGYAKAVGGANPATDTGAVTNRLLASLTPAGTISMVANSDSVGSSNVRSGVMSGTTAYLSTSTGVRYMDTSVGTTSVLVDSRNSRQAVLTPANELLVSNGSSTIAAKLQSYGVLPSSSTVGTAVVTLATSDAIHGFWAADLNSTVPGIDTIYALSTVGNSLLKYSLVGSTWTANGSITATGIQNIVGVPSGSGVDLYLTSPSALLKFSDPSGYNATITSGSATAFATAFTNTGFRGIGMFSPVPEPSLVALVALGLVGTLRRRRTV